MGLSLLTKILKLFFLGIFPIKVCEQYNNLKKIFVNNSEPENVSKLKIKFINANLIETAWMAGAGGGGYLYLWLKENKTIKDINNFLASEVIFTYICF